MAQELGEVAFGAGAARRFHAVGEAREVTVQALDLVQDGGALGLAKIAEMAGRAVERRVPVDATARGVDLGDRQQVGMFARQALGDRRTQLPRGAPDRITRQAQRAVALERFTAEKGTCHLTFLLPRAARTGHAVGPTCAPHLSCYDDIDRIIPGDRIPVEAEAAAAAARPARAASTWPR